MGRWSNPKKRSQLGEAWLLGALRRMGLRDDLHFEVQKRVRILGSRGARDGVIDVLLRLPNAKGLALDSKFPWAGHLASVVDVNDDVRDVGLRKLRDALRTHIKDIAGREYHRADGIEIRHVWVIVPDWQTLDMVKAVDGGITEFAAERRVGLVPADGLFEICAALGELHREEGWGEKIRDLFNPDDADRMYAACCDLLERLECVVKRHNSAGDAIAELTSAFGPNGLIGRDVLAPASRAAEKVDLELQKEAKEVDSAKVVRHRERLEARRTELTEAKKHPEAA